MDYKTSDLPWCANQEYDGIDNLLRRIKTEILKGGDTIGIWVYPSE